MTDLEWLQKIRALPFLMQLADARTAGGATGDRYEVMAELRAQHEAEETPYVWTTVYRHPPAPCSTGEHTIASLTHELVRPGIPGKYGRLMISEMQLHDIEHHGRKLAADQIRKLEAIV